MALQRYDISTKAQTIIWFLFNLSIVGLLYLGFGLKEVIIASLGFGIVRLIVYFFIFKKILPSIPLQIRFNFTVQKKYFLLVPLLSLMRLPLIWFSGLIK